jgi:arabinofuranosyltransferase
VAINGERKIRLLRIAGAGTALILVVTVLRNAWLTDDCYITFRTVWNLWQGHGLRWNVIERVQTFTHPLWLGVLAPIYGLTGKAWLTAWIAGIGLTSATALAVMRVARTPGLGLAGLLLLLSSRAFVDFGTSGLENPLSWLLLVLFVGALSRASFRGPPLIAGLLTGLLLLNRLDHILLVLPALTLVFVRSNGRGRRLLLLGVLPLLLWLGFSLVYFGSPLPNTFHAKVLTGFPRPVLLAQGLRYLADSLVNDFATLPVILLAVALPLHGRHRDMWPLAAGLVLKVCYVLWIGGDFMTGRFFADPFVFAVAMLITWRGSAKRILPGAVVVLTLAVAHPHHPLKVGPDYYQDRTGRERELFPAGIVDEKGMAWRRSSPFPLGRRCEAMELEARLDEQATVFDPAELKLQVHVAVGARGYVCGPNVHILDRLAITDPLLARLPAREDLPWRIGHFFRWVPEGYPQSVVQGGNRIEDPGLRPLYDDMVLVTRGPLWTAGRWRAIVRWNTGIDGRRVDGAFYRNPPADAREGGPGPE